MDYGIVLPRQSRTPIRRVPQELVSPTTLYSTLSPPESNRVRISQCIVALLIIMSDDLSSSSDEDIVVADILLEQEKKKWIHDINKKRKVFGELEVGAFAVEEHHEK
uniref:Uncharacterized protein n=1 Tax=Timema shepardi TaxID=629360 RepID=A0A7R9G5Y2_TIMSH|nr:unnamed protein product [Timema shepardi]